MAEYRYIFSTLRTEQVVQEIPVYGVYMNMGMNGDGGQFDATFQLDQTGKHNEDLLDATIPGRTYVVPERNGIPIGAYYIWSRVYSAQSKTVQLHGQSFDRYPRKQRVLTNISYTNIEQREIFKGLWTHMQSVFGRNINIIIPSGTFPTVVTKSIEVVPSDIRYYDEVMSSISNGSNGFDWYISVVKDGINYRKNLLVGYPTLGVPISTSNVVFEYPGSITNYYMTESMANGATNILLVGAGEGSDMVTSEVEHTDLLNSGMARWDVDVSRKDINNQNLLDSLAENEAGVRRAPMTTIKISIKGDGIPEIGSFSLGDYCTIIFNDARNPNGFRKDSRLVKWELHPSSSDSVEEASLIFEGDEDE